MKNAIPITLLLINCMSGICYPKRNITVHELINSYDQLKERTSNKYIKSETIREDEDSWAKKSDWSICRSEFYTDGTRIDLTIGEWISIRNKDDREFFFSRDSSRVIWDKSRWYQYKQAEIIKHESVFISKREKWKNDYCSTGYNGAPLEGFFRGDEKTVSSIFHEADQVILCDEKENINGVQCYVLKADTAHGNYKIWLDPEHGYNISQAEVIRTGDDLYYSKPLSTPSPDWIKRIKIPEGKPPVPTSLKIKSVFKMNNVKFQKDNGIWVPVSSDWEEKITYENGRVITKRFNHKRIEFDLSPDFEAVKAFVPNIPNGTRARIEGENPIIPYQWVDGKVEPNVDGEVLESTDAMIEELIKESPVENKTSLRETGQKNNSDKPKNIKEEDISKTMPVLSETSKGTSKPLFHTSLVILGSGMMFGLVVFIVFLIKKRGHNV